MKGDARVQNIEYLFEKYKDDVYRLALSYTKSVQDAEDVCQNVFLKAMKQNIRSGKEKAWLMQVAANECRNLLRSSWWKKTEGLTEEGICPEPEYSDVFREVMTLPPKYRVVIYLRYYEEYTTKEIAQLLRISQTAVTTRLSRAKDMLKSMLREEYV